MNKTRGSIVLMAGGIIVAVGFALITIGMLLVLEKSEKDPFTFDVFLEPNEQFSRTIELEKGTNYQIFFKGKPENNLINSEIFKNGERHFYKNYKKELKSTFTPPDTGTYTMTVTNTGTQRTLVNVIVVNESTEGMFANIREYALAKNPEVVPIMSVGFVTGVYIGIPVIIVGIILHRKDKKNAKTREIFVTKKPVNVNRHTIYAVVPYLEFWAFYRIEKLRKYLLLYVGYEATNISVSQLFLIPPEYSLFLYWPVAVPINIFLVRRWARKWNEQIKQNKID